MKIITKSDNKKRISEKYLCSLNSVSKALRFQSNSLLSRRIRHFAMNYMRSYYLPNSY